MVTSEQQSTTKFVTGNHKKCSKMFEMMKILPIIFIFCLQKQFLRVSAKMGKNSPEILRFSGQFRARMIMSVITYIRDNFVRSNYVR